MEGVASPVAEKSKMSKLDSKTFKNDQLEDNAVNSLENSVDNMKINETTKKEKNKSPKKRKNRCNMCRKKLGLVPFDCKCGGSFCTVHRYTDEHKCTYNWKQEGKDKLKEDNPQVVADKIIRI
jgi:predicted nucleic acid binding AN1-type Zn finger protein